MKSFFRVELQCPYCQKTFAYHILSFKARKQCPHCEYDLLVRTKAKMSVILSIIGFILLAILSHVLGIDQLNRAINLVYWVIGCFVYIALSYKLVCTIKSPSALYSVDMEDPTVLERKGKRK